MILKNRSLSNMDLTDFIEEIWLPKFKAAENSGDIGEGNRLINILIEALQKAKVESE